MSRILQVHRENVKRPDEAAVFDKARLLVDAWAKPVICTLSPRSTEHSEDIDVTRDQNN